MPRPAKSQGKPKPNSKGRSAKSKHWLRPLHWLRVLAMIFFLSTALAVLFFRFVPPPLTPLMAIRYTSALFGPKEATLKKSWRSLNKISPQLVEAVIASEDQLFFEHTGFDWDAILSAFSINEKGKRKIGASTITQQTAKNLFLWPERSWTRKALEAYFTLLLEVLWSKPRILEVYLNIIEMGDGIYGAEAASQKYFGISAAKLDSHQAALIAASLPNPRVWSPANPTAYLIRRQAWILRQMRYRAPLPAELKTQKEVTFDKKKPKASTTLKQMDKDSLSEHDSLDSMLPFPMDSLTPEE